MFAVAAVVIAATVPPAVSSIRTYQRNRAARQVLAGIRLTQSQAVMRGGVFGLQWGSDTGVDRPPGQYRIVRDTTGSCGIPAVSAPADDTDVIRDWQDLSSEYSGATIQSIRDSNNKSVGTVMFNSMGASVNTCASVAFPLTVTVSDASGTTRTLQIRSAGSTRLR
jgi:type II secretory pathway pseudopilin PulG